MKNEMTYEQAIEYIKSLDVYGSVLGLDNMKALAKELKNPQNTLRFVHITGTNGKGSTSAFLSNALIQAGYKVGTYNSPSVVDGTDQFKINMKRIGKKLYAKAVNMVREACFSIICETGNHPTRFEVETMAAFVAFSLKKCDIVILETGLGGKDDATNIITTEILHVFMPISMDHSEALGNTLEKIAENKAGIIKNSAPTVVGIGEFSELSLPVIERKCKEVDSKIFRVSPDMIENIRIGRKHLIFEIKENEELALTPIKLKLSMKGAYQPLNALVALSALNVLSDIGFDICEEDVKKGIKKIKIPFRFQEINCLIKKNDDTHLAVDIILDGAHNPDGAMKFIESLDLNYQDRKKIFISGIFKDKDYKKIAKITGNKAEKIYVIENTKSARALDKNILANEFSKYNSDVVIADSVESAIDGAINNIQDEFNENTKNPVICCFGSLSWLNEAYEYIKEKWN